MIIVYGQTHRARAIRRAIKGWINTWVKHGNTLVSDDGNIMINMKPLGIDPEFNNHECVIEIDGYYFIPNKEYVICKNGDLCKISFT